MSAFLPGIPEPGEFNPAFAGYVDKARSFADPVQKIEQQLDEMLSLLRPLHAGKQMHRYAAGKWSVKQVLGHITDAERIFSYRLLRIARADPTPLPPFEENAYVTASEVERCEWSELIAEFQHVRRSTILLLRHIPEAAWRRMGTSSGAPTSVRALAYIMIGHVAHHLGILRERYGL
jgi:hypothetical protein